MKICFFNDYRLGIVKGDTVVDVTDAVKDIPHTGPHNLINGLIERQVREFIAAERQNAIAESTQARDTAHAFGQAALLAVVPELSHLPIEQWAEGLNLLAEVDPGRAQSAVNLLGRVGAIQQAQQQEQQQQGECCKGNAGQLGIPGSFSQTVRDSNLEYAAQLIGRGAEVIPQAGASGGARDHSRVL